MDGSRNQNLPVLKEVFSDGESWRNSQKELLFFLRSDSSLNTSRSAKITFSENFTLSFKISPFSFFQTNSFGAEVLYQTARDYIGDLSNGSCPDKIVFDLYSGTGTIAQLMAPVSGKVIGVEIVEQAVKDAKTVVWNGPMGVFENPILAAGTIAVAKSLAETDATTIIGGGDSAAAVNTLGFGPKMTHISTGGGASLEFLEGKALPGIEAVNDK